MYKTSRKTGAVILGVLLFIVTISFAIGIYSIIWHEEECKKLQAEYEKEPTIKNKNELRYENCET